MSYYCNKKERIPDYLKSTTRIKEHCGLDKNSPIFNHLAECNLYEYTINLHSFPCDGEVTLTNQDMLKHIRTAVISNVRITGKAENWAELCFSENLNIKWKKSLLNTDMFPESSSISQLDPFLDNRGILQVGGRFRKSNLTEEENYLVLLPNKCVVSNMIIQWSHHSVAFGAKGMTLSYLKQKGIWTVNANAIV